MSVSAVSSEWTACMVPVGTWQVGPATTYPEITFASTEITELDDGRLAIAGQLTIRRVTRPIELTGTVEGVGLDPWGTSGSCSCCGARSIVATFGLTWNKALETAGALVADQVGIEIDISAVNLAADAAA